MKLVNVIWFNPESRVIGIVVGEDESLANIKPTSAWAPALQRKFGREGQILNHGAPFTIPLQTGQLLKTMVVASLRRRRRVMRQETTGLEECHYSSILFTKLKTA